MPKFAIKLGLRPFHPVPTAMTGPLRIKAVSGIPAPSGAPFMPTLRPATLQKLPTLFTSNAGPSTPPPTHTSVAAILEGTPSIEGLWSRRRGYDAMKVASGETRFPRLEALVAHLVGHLPSPHIVERGPGNFAALAIALARRYSITVIEQLNVVHPLYDEIPPPIRNNIKLLDVAHAPKHPTADLGIWIHPIPYVMKGYDGIFNYAVMGQDIKPGGYLVVQTEASFTIPPSSAWELLHDGLNIGILAPTLFVDFPGKTIVLRRALPLPADWHTLAQSNPEAFTDRVRRKIAVIKNTLRERIARRELTSVMNAWYQNHVLPELEIINAAFKIHFPRTRTTERHNLARDLMIMSNSIPVFLMAEDIVHVSLTLDEVGK